MPAGSVAGLLEDSPVVSVAAIARRRDLGKGLFVIMSMGVTVVMLMLAMLIMMMAAMVVVVSVR